ncbi:hypothetical protein [Micromonospora endolithica]|uniref:Uncharacterized protein n=1 Tax=Micromonospora endolithica TaxID=230091 RepID=A0A3A9YX86_9ACTN|nr:hypothetical protein [Micromonospora endolithica]RKN40643.1 hypothetical protein D7223_26285 [Micromonospora endolithica]TWJ21733.1 hypothetical protein JD76_01844 [Micromonospora endolithica]
MANAVGQDGDALIPLAALRRQSAAVTTVITTNPGRRGGRRPAPAALNREDVTVSPPIARTRRKLVAFAVLTVVASLVGLPGATVVALAAVSVAIPVAVACAGGGALLRDLLVPGDRRRRGGGLGHTTEQGERFVT